MAEENKIDDYLSLDKNIKEYVENIDSIYEIINLTMNNINHEFKKIQGDIRQYLKINADTIEEEDDEIRYLLKWKKVKAFENLVQKQNKYINAYQIVPRSLLISLITQFDVFLGNTVRTLAILKPECLNLGEKQLTFTQLSRFSSVEEARIHLVDKEVDVLLRMSHAEMIKWLESRFNFVFPKKSDIWKTFIEVTERRNLFVHTSGKVSNQYINICKEHGVTLPEGTDLNKELEVSPKYFRLAYECIYEIGIEIVQTLWRKLLTKELAESDSSLIATTYDLLINKKYRIAQRVLDFATEYFKKYSSEKNKYILLVNRAQSYKWVGNEEKAKEITKSVDWSAASNDFKLAEAVLLDDFERADRIVKEIGSKGPVTQESYREWPLFRKYREHEGFLKAFAEIFSESLHEEIFSEPFPVENTKRVLGNDVEMLEELSNAYGSDDEHKLGDLKEIIGF